MFFLKKNYIVKFSTSSIFKKISKDNFETKKFKKKEKKKKKSILSKKKTCEKKNTAATVNIPHVLEYYIYKGCFILENTSGVAGVTSFSNLGFGGILNNIDRSANRSLK